MYRAAIEAHGHLPADRWTPVERSRIERKVAEALVRLGRHEEARKQIVTALGRLGLNFPEKKGAVKRATLIQLAPRLLGPPAIPRPDATPDPAEVEIGLALELLGWVTFFRDHDLYALTTLMLANRASRAGFLDGMAIGTFRSAVAFSSLGKEKLSRAYMERALEAANGMTDEIEIARLKQGLSLIPLCVGGFEEALASAELGTSLGTAARDLRSRGAGGAAVSLAVGMHGDLVRSRELAEGIVADATEGGERPVQTLGHTAASLCAGLMPELGVMSARAGIEVARTVPDYLMHMCCLGTLARAQLRLGDLAGAAASIEEGMKETDQRGFRGFLTAFLFQAEAELTLLELARVRNRTTIAASKRATRRSLRAAPVARWHAVYAHTFAGGHAWILGKSRPAERSFARAGAIADQYDWPGAHADACTWVAHCCAEAAIDLPPQLETQVMRAPLAQRSPLDT
jgi:hypothetical protein